MQVGLDALTTWNLRKSFLKFKDLEVGKVYRPSECLFYVTNENDLKIIEPTQAFMLISLEIEPGFSGDSLGKILGPDNTGFCFVYDTKQVRFKEVKKF